jgi:hypothetical protein
MGRMLQARWAIIASAACHERDCAGLSAPAGLDSAQVQADCPLEGTPSRTRSRRMRQPSTRVRFPCISCACTPVRGVLHGCQILCLAPRLQALLRAPCMAASPLHARRSAAVSGSCGAAGAPPCCALQFAAYAYSEEEGRQTPVGSPMRAFEDGAASDAWEPPKNGCLNGVPASKRSARKRTLTPKAELATRQLDACEVDSPLGHRASDRTSNSQILSPYKASPAKSAPAKLSHARGGKSPAKAPGAPVGKRVRCKSTLSTQAPGHAASIMPPSNENAPSEAMKLWCRNVDRLMPGGVLHEAHARTSALKNQIMSDLLCLYFALFRTDVSENLAVHCTLLPTISFLSGANLEKPPPPCSNPAVCQLRSSVATLRYTKHFVKDYQGEVVAANRPVWPLLHRTLSCTSASLLRCAHAACSAAGAPGKRWCMRFVCWQHVRRRRDAADEERESEAPEEEGRCEHNRDTLPGHSTAGIQF